MFFAMTSYVREIKSCANYEGFDAEEQETGKLEALHWKVLEMAINPLILLFNLLSYEIGEGG